MRIRFVTTNAGKLAEAASILGAHGHEVEGSDATPVEIQADALDEVALHKAQSVRGAVTPPYFVEDAGLLVDALGGFPGVYSAYAMSSIGCEGILRLLEGVSGSGRRARFEARVALVLDDAPARLMGGSVLGRIATTARGTSGFGFDPVFVADELPDRTFAELSRDEKNRLSHRGRAMRALAAALVEGGDGPRST